MDTYLAKAAELLGVNVPALQESAQQSQNEIKEFEKSLLMACSTQGFGDTIQTKVDVVIHGAHARGEATPGSDCDYLVVTRGASPETTRFFRKAAEQVIAELNLRKPGGEGAFGSIAIASELYERIGLEEDTNVNTTRRILFLTESISVYSEKTRKDIVNEILSRYCADPPNRQPDEPAKVPRFLLNDLVRYWRTIAVDFGAKRWRSLKEDYHLRLAKLQTTRKILFVGPLSTLLLVPNRVGKHEDLPEYLENWLEKPPLAQLVSSTGHLASVAKEAMASLLVEYNNFFELLHQEEVRNIFKNPNSPGFDELQKKVKLIGDNIQESLEVIFFDDPLFKSNTRKYGIF